jgi:hypothetical protein
MTGRNGARLSRAEELLASFGVLHVRIRATMRAVSVVLIKRR